MNSTTLTNGRPVNRLTMKSLDERLKQVETAPPAQTDSDFAYRLTVAIGIAIPVLSLCMSSITGELVSHEHYELGAFTGGVVLCILGVSLTHLAHALEDLTRSPWWLAWPMAIVLDCALVGCELVNTLYPELGLSFACWFVMGIVGIFSALLNCHAFLNPRGNHR